MTHPHPRPARHLSVVPPAKPQPLSAAPAGHGRAQGPQPKVLDAYGKPLSVGDLICLLARHYSRKQQDEVWRIESLTSDVAKVQPIRGFLRPLSYDFPLKDIALYAKEGAPTPYLEGQR